MPLKVLPKCAPKRPKNASKSDPQCSKSDPKCPAPSKFLKMHPKCPKKCPFFDLFFDFYQCYVIRNALKHVFSESTPRIGPGGQISRSLEIFWLIFCNFHVKKSECMKSVLAAVTPREFPSRCESATRIAHRRTRWSRLALFLSVGISMWNG